MSSEDIQHNVLFIKSVQLATLRGVFNAFKEWLEDINIRFTPEGIQVFEMNDGQSIFVHSELYASKFEFYYCKFPKITIGINAKKLVNRFNNTSNDETVTIFISNKNYGSEDYIKNLDLVFENKSKNQIRRDSIHLINPNASEYSLPDVEYSSVMVFPSQDFQSIVRGYNQWVEDVEIKTVGRKLIFCGSSSKGNDYSEIHRTERSPLTYIGSVVKEEGERGGEGGIGGKKGGVSGVAGGVDGEEDERTKMTELNPNQLMFCKYQDESNIVQGKFKLKHLACIAKCTSMNPLVDLYLETDMPLTAKYKAGSLGYVGISIKCVEDELELD